MTTLDVTTARQEFAELLNRASYGGQRIAIRRRGKVLAGIVSAEDLALLERLHTLQDIKEVKKALAEAHKKGHEPIPWEEAKQRLGL